VIDYESLCCYLLPLRRYKRKSDKVGMGHFECKFQTKWGHRPPTTVGDRQLV